jgi:DNA-binding response OmpR family regulator
VRILLLEDEPKLAGAVKQGIEAEGHSVNIAVSGEDGFYLAQTQPFDLLIFDIMLPGRDGIEILRDLRRLGLRTPVLLLTAKDAIEDRVRGLDSGADDYLGKPFAFPELLARVRALARRGKPETRGPMHIGDLELDRTRHSVIRGGHELDLTAKEFDLLEYLMRHSGEVVSREMLAREVWNEPARHTAMDNLIDVQIARLRRKLDDPFRQKLLNTIRGVGFILRSDLSR